MSDYTPTTEAAEVVRILDAHDKLIYSGKGVPAPEAIRDNARIRVEVREMSARIADLEAERDVALAVIEQVRRFRLDRYLPAPLAASVTRTLATSPPDALDAVKFAAWNECLDAIEKHELNTEQARSGNPYRNPRTPGEETT